MLSVIVGSTETSLDDGTICRLLGYDGWGMSPIERLSQRGPLQHGESDLGFHLNPREGTLILGLEETTLESMYDKREQLLDLFKPQNDPKLQWALPNGVTRRIDVHLVDDLSMSWRPESWAALKIGLTLKAPDPSFYDPVLKLAQFTIEQLGELVFSITFPIKFNNSVINEGAVISNTGTWISYPTIELTGPMENPKIENLTIGDELQLLYSVSAGEVITIDLSPGAKMIENSTGENLIGTLSDDSDLGTFRLETDPIAPNGNNSIQVQLGGASAATLVEFKYYLRYIGL